VFNGIPSQLYIVDFVPLWLGTNIGKVPFGIYLIMLKPTPFRAWSARAYEDAIGTHSIKFSGHGLQAFNARNKWIQMKTTMNLVGLPRRSWKHPERSLLNAFASELPSCWGT